MTVKAVQTTLKSLGQFILERRMMLGLRGRELVAQVLNGDGKPISIPYLVDLEHDRRKPSDRVLEQLATALKTDSDILYHLAGRIPADLTPSVVSEDRLAAAWRAFRRAMEGDCKAGRQTRRAMM